MQPSLLQLAFQPGSGLLIRRGPQRVEQTIDRRLLVGRTLRVRGAAAE